MGKSRLQFPGRTKGTDRNRWEYTWLPGLIRTCRELDEIPVIEAELTLWCDARLRRFRFPCWHSSVVPALATNRNQSDAHGIRIQGESIAVAVPAGLGFRTAWELNLQEWAASTTPSRASRISLKFDANRRSNDVEAA